MGAAPSCPTPVYDATTCASVIKTAVDAKKCAPIFGLKYNDSNENVKNVMTAFQNVINKLQELVCSSQYKYLVFKLVSPIEGSNISESAAKLKEDSQKIADSMVLSDKDIHNGITKEQFEQVKSLILVLQNVLITVNTGSDGKVNAASVKKAMNDILNSLCLDYKAPPEIKLTRIIDERRTLNYTSPLFSTKQKFKAGEIKKLIINEVFFNFKELKNSDNKFYLYITNNDKKLVSLEGKAGDFKNINGMYLPISPDGDLTIDIYAADSERINAYIYLNIDAEYNNTVSKSTFSAILNRYSKSNFGSMGSGFLIFIVLLLIAGGVLYYLHSKGKVKIPGLPQRIAAFGRQIKAIRKM
jgi:hypothetical protein